MKKTLYIFRHGETNYNVEKRMQGWLDIPLNENGVAQAHILAKKLNDVKFDKDYFGVYISSKGDIYGKDQNSRRPVYLRQPGKAR